VLRFFWAFTENNGVERRGEERRGKERKGKELSLATVAQSVLKGLVVRCIYALVALGMTLNFGMMTNIQFAYGEIYM
jgi:hypothetical protein